MGGWEELERMAWEGMASEVLGGSAGGNEATATYTPQMRIVSPGTSHCAGPRHDPIRHPIHMQAYHTAPR